MFLPVESHKRKAEDGESDEEDVEPPPVPPRKRAPPEKPPRQLENTETTAAEESLKQKKMVESLRGTVRIFRYVSIRLLHLLPKKRYSGVQRELFLDYFKCNYRKCTENDWRDIQFNEFFPKYMT